MMDERMEAARAWDEAFAEWKRLDGLGEMYRGARDAQAEKMSEAMERITAEMEQEDR